MIQIHKKQQKIRDLSKQTTNTIHDNTNYNRVENHRNIQFTCEEIQLLSKGSKYNLHHKRKKWIQTLALVAETALGHLDITDQNYQTRSCDKHKKTLARTVI